MATSIVGTGEYQYHCNRSWASLPRGWSFGMSKTGLRAVAVDSRDRVYAYNCGDEPVVVFGSDGTFAGAWGKGKISDPHGIYISPDDEVFLVDRDAHQVLKFTTEGELVMTLGTRNKPSLEAPFNHPTDVSVGPNGDIFVSDGYANSRVHRFTSDGQLLLSWGKPGIGPGEFNALHSVWVDSDARVYVCDRDNNRIQVFSDEGEFIAQWPYFFRPTDLYMDKKGALYVTDFTPRFTVLNREGTILSRGRLEDSAHGLWGDSKGDFYVALVFEKRLEKHERHFRLETEDRGPAQSES